MTVAAESAGLIEDNGQDVLCRDKIGIYTNSFVSPLPDPSPICYSSILPMCTVCELESSWVVNNACYEFDGRPLHSYRNSTTRNRPITPTVGRQ